MTAMVRKQIYIEPEQEVQLKRISGETGDSEAEIIRRAIGQHILIFRRHRRNAKIWEDELAFIRNLIEQGPVEGGRTWRREDLYDR